MERAVPPDRLLPPEGNQLVRARSPNGIGRVRSYSVRSFRQVLFPDAGTNEGVGKHDQLTEEDKHPGPAPASQRVRQSSLEEGENGASEHAHHENAGSLGGVFFQPHGGERENAAPHDGMEQPYGNQHPQVMGVNGDQRQDGRRGGSRRQLDAGGNMVQPAGDDAAHHQAAPVQGGQQGRNAQVHTPNHQVAGAQKQQRFIRIAEFQGVQVYIDAHGHLRSHIKENGDHAQGQMPEGPDAAFQLFSFSGRGVPDVGQVKAPRHQGDQRNEDAQDKQGKHQLPHVDALHGQSGKQDAGHEKRRDRGSEGIHGADDVEALDGLRSLQFIGRHVGIDDDLQNRGGSAHGIGTRQKNKIAVGNAGPGDRRAQIPELDGEPRGQEKDGQPKHHEQESPYQRRLVAVAVDPAGGDISVHQVRQEKEKGNQGDERVFQGAGVRQEGALQRPLELAVHGGQEPDEKINEGQGKERAQA